MSRGDAGSSNMIDAWNSDLQSGLVHPLTKHIVAVLGSEAMLPTSSTAIRATISGNANPTTAVEAWVESGDLSSGVANDLLSALLSPSGGVAPLLARSSGVAWSWDQYDQNTAENTFNFGHPMFDAVLAMPPAAATAAATAQWINSAGAYIIRRKSETDKWELLVQDPGNSDRCRLIGGYRKPESLACKILAMRSECWHEANVVFTKKLLRQATAPGFFARPDGMVETDRTNGGVVMVQVFELDYAESCNGELQSRESGAELGWVEMASVALRDPIEQECLAWVQKTMLPTLGVALIPTTFQTNIVADAKHKKEASCAGSSKAAKAARAAAKKKAKQKGKKTITSTTVVLPSSPKLSPASTPDQLRLVINAAAFKCIQALEANAAELASLLQLATASVEQLPLVRYEDYKSLDGSINARKIDALTL